MVAKVETMERERRKDSYGMVDLPLFLSSGGCNDNGLM